MPSGGGVDSSHAPDSLRPTSGGTRRRPSSPIRVHPARHAAAETPTPVLSRSCEVVRCGHYGTAGGRGEGRPPRRCEAPHSCSDDLTNVDESRQLGYFSYPKASKRAKRISRAVGAVASSTVLDDAPDYPTASPSPSDPAGGDATGKRPGCPQRLSRERTRRRGRQGDGGRKSRCLTLYDLDDMYPCEDGEYDDGTSTSPTSSTSLATAWPTTTRHADVATTGYETDSALTDENQSEQSRQRRPHDAMTPSETGGDVVACTVVPTASAGVEVRRDDPADSHVYDALEAVRATAATASCPPGCDRMAVRRQQLAPLQLVPPHTPLVASTAIVGRERNGAEPAEKEENGVVVVVDEATRPASCSDQLTTTPCEGLTVEVPAAHATLPPPGSGGIELAAAVVAELVPPVAAGRRPLLGARSYRRALLSGGGQRGLCRYPVDRLSQQALHSPTGSATAETVPAECSRRGFPCLFERIAPPTVTCNVEAYQPCVARATANGHECAASPSPLSCGAIDADRCSRAESPDCTDCRMCSMETTGSYRGGDLAKTTTMMRCVCASWSSAEVPQGSAGWHGPEQQSPMQPHSPVTAPPQLSASHDGQTPSGGPVLGGTCPFPRDEPSAGVAAAGGLSPDRTSTWPMTNRSPGGLVVPNPAPQSCHRCCGRRRRYPAYKAADGEGVWHAAVVGKPPGKRCGFSAVVVLPGLLLGSYADASSIDAVAAHGVSLVVNMASECEVTPQMKANRYGIHYRQFPLRDHSDENIEEVLRPILALIHEQRTKYFAAIEAMRRRDPTCALSPATAGLSRLSPQVEGAPAATAASLGSSGSGAGSPSASHNSFALCVRHRRAAINSQLLQDHCGGVLVHCRMGVSRSATIVLAYLMQYGTSPPRGVGERPQGCDGGWHHSAAGPADGDAIAIGSPTDATAAVAAPEAPLVAAASSGVGNSCRMNSSLCHGEEAPSGAADRARRGDDAEVVTPPKTSGVMSYRAAFDFLKGRKRDVNPNFGFALALRRLDVEHGYRSDVFADVHSSHEY